MRFSVLVGALEGFIADLHVVLNSRNVFSCRRERLRLKKIVRALRRPTH